MLRGLHKLCDKAHWAEVVDALESSRNDPNEKGGFGEWTPLHLVRLPWMFETLHDQR